MKITIDLQDDLLQRAKKAAMEARTTLDEHIENALREWLAKRQAGKPRSEFK